MSLLDTSKINLTHFLNMAVVHLGLSKCVKFYGLTYLSAKNASELGFKNNNPFKLACF